VASATTARNSPARELDDRQLLLERHEAKRLTLKQHLIEMSVKLNARRIT
jgi:hypothetical protein